MSYVTDTFTDTAGTALNAHTGELGATWEDFGNGANADAIKISAAGRVYSDAVSGMSWASGVATGAYAAKVKVTAVTAINGAVGLIVSASKASNNCYLLWLYTGANDIELYRNAGGSYSKVRNGAHAISTGESVWLVALVNASGNTITCYKSTDGVTWSTAFSAYTDGSPITNTGRAGIRADVAVTDSTGLHLDDLSVEPAIAIGNLEVTSINGSSVSLSATASSPFGGLTYRWDRSTTSAFTIGAGTLLAGETSSTLTDSPTAGQWHYYRCTVTDAIGQTITSYERPVKLGTVPAAFRPYPASFSVASLSLVAIGDSTSTADVFNSNVAPIDQVKTLIEANTDLTVSVVNTSVAGSWTDLWLPDSTNLNNAIAAAGGSFAGKFVHVRLGINDAQIGNSAATFGANLSDIVDEIVAQGGKVILSYPTYREPGSHAPTNSSITFDESTTARLIAYMPYVDALVDDVDVFAGDRDSYTAFASLAPDYLYDRIHQNDDGNDLMARYEADAVLAVNEAAGQAAHIANTLIYFDLV